jgi:hypothetical protein
MASNAYQGGVHIERTGSLVLPIPLAQAFPLFTAEGERSWVPGWEPQYLHPPHPSDAEGTVFRTDHGGEETFWLVLRHDPFEGAAVYGRFTPGSRLGTVKVQCVERTTSETVVNVTYSLTALSASGDEVLAAMTPQAYDAMLEEWSELIIRGVNGRPGDAT